MKSKTMTAMWRCLFSAHCHRNRLLQICSQWHCGGTSAGSFMLFLRLQVILRPWRPSELFQLSLVFTSGHHWYHTTCQKFTKDILRWVTLSQGSSHMPCRFISDISIPNIMEHLSLEEPPEGGEQRIFQDIDAIQVSPHRPGSCAPESVVIHRSWKNGGWKTTCFLSGEGNCSGANC